MSRDNQEEEITFDYDLIKGVEKPIPTWEIRFTYQIGNNSFPYYEESETAEFEIEDTIGLKNYINGDLQEAINEAKFVAWYNNKNKKLYSVELWYVLYDITEYENQTLWEKN